MEATATWAEDQLYDDVNDNVQYLRTSPLAQPCSLDGPLLGPAPVRRLDLLPLPHRALPRLRRRPCPRSSGTSGSGSTRPAAGPTTTRCRPSRRSWPRSAPTCPRVFGDFADANRRPATSYQEGADEPLPGSPRCLGRTTLSGGHRASGVLTRRVDHLASATIRFTRGAALSASALRLQVDLPPTARGSAVRVTRLPALGRPGASAPSTSARRATRPRTWTSPAASSTSR